jgi:hypothetical protein
VVLFHKVPAPSVHETRVCAFLAALEIVLQITWRRQDMKQPLPDLRYWISDGIIFLALLATVWLARQAHQDHQDRDPSRLYIFYAHFRWGNWPWQYGNATKTIRSRITNNCVNMPITINILGDLKPGRAKTLTVKYSYAGFTRLISLPEQYPKWPSRLVLPAQELRKELEKMLAEFPAC